MPRSTRVLVLAGAFACSDPTEIRPQITTDVACATVIKNGVDIRIGSPSSVETNPSEELTTQACTAGATGNSLGDLVIVPSGSGDTAAVTLVLGVDIPTTSCVIAKPDGCIVARRIVSYITHRSLDLPIDLASRCKGVACPANQTCLQGACVEIRSVGDAGDAGPPDTGIVEAGCGDTQTAPKNCGKCGFDCSGGQCQGGLCNLYPPGPIEALAAGACIAASPAGVFVTTGATGSGIGDVLQFPLNGGAPKFAEAGSGATFGIAASATEVYYAASYAVAPLLLSVTSVMYDKSQYTGAVATDGAIVCAAVMSTPGVVECAAGGVVLAPSAGQPVKLAMQSGWLYATWSTGEVYKVNLAGPPNPLKLASGTTPNGIAIAMLGQLEYVSNGNWVDSLTEPATLTHAFTQLAQPLGLAYDAASQTLYIADKGGGFATGTIYAASGTMVTPIATGQAVPDCIAIDGAAVYWLNGSTPMKAAR